MEFGIFDSFDLGRGSVREVIAGRLRFAELAEGRGISHYHVTEHHGTPLSVCPSPNLFLAALSQRTTTMRIGALVNVLPSYDPFRLAEEIATLDQLCAGRLDLGVGSGVSPYELDIFGVDIAEAKARYAEALTAITTALRTGLMRHDGDLLRSYDAELSVLPVQRPYPPLWYASSNAATAEWAGRNAVNFVGRWNGGSFPDLAATYRNALHSTEFSAHDRLNPHHTVPRLGIAASVVIADSDAHAQDIFARAHGLFCERITHLWHRNGDHRLDSAFAVDTVLANGGACVGTVATVRNQIVHQVESSGANYYEMSLFFGDMTDAEASHTLGAFTEHVAPAVRAAGSSSA